MFYLALLAQASEVEQRKKKAAQQSTPASCPPNRTQDRTEPTALRRQRAMIAIRRLVSEGMSNKDIIRTLGISRRSFYRWTKQVYEQDKKILQQQDRSMLALELQTLKHRLTDSYRRLNAAACDSKASIPDRLKAEQASAEVAIVIARLAFESPLIMKGHADLLDLTN